MSAPLKNNERLLVTLRAGYLRAGASGRSVLLAVSGGGDSMALLDATASLASGLRMRCAVASVDHGLRPEAQRELALVEREARARRLAFHAARVSVARGPGLEARARDARYDALQRIRRAERLDLVATAHTASDQAETVLMRLTRGASLSGAAGIHPTRGTIIRPMLGCTRDEVRSYLEVRGVPFIDDPMNSDPEFLRTRVRREVLPALEGAAGPAAAKMIARFAELAAEDSELLDAWAEAAERRLKLADGGLDAVGLQLAQRPLRRRIVARMLTEAGLAVDSELIGRVDRALSGERETVALPRGALLRLKGGRVRVDARRSASSSGALGYLELEGDPIMLAEEQRVLTWTRTPEGKRAQRIPSPISDALLVRRRRPGDRLRLSNGRTRKLQDVLTDARVPREARGALIVLADSDDQVVCVVGVWPKPGAGAYSSACSWLVDASLVSERAEAALVGYKR